MLYICVCVYILQEIQHREFSSNFFLTNQPVQCQKLKICLVEILALRKIIQIEIQQMCVEKYAITKEQTSGIEQNLGYVLSDIDSVEVFSGGVKRGGFGKHERVSLGELSSEQSSISG